MADDTHRIDVTLTKHERDDLHHLAALGRAQHDFDLLMSATVTDIEQEVALKKQAAAAIRGCEVARWLLGLRGRP